ncbi:hypothetical protein U9M48_038114 [Paspalum notatum var. saurae]|uniref:MADS-box domain-containing protein n=1 Tax=Paspalum notatum var. saurae TaxID=547442 RepID=A0AAQ3UKN7_PASNO
MEEKVVAQAARRTTEPQLLPPPQQQQRDDGSSKQQGAERRKRGRVVLRRIEERTSRQVRFSKRRSGLFKKAHELSVLCDARVALVVFSPAGRFYQFASAGSSIEEIFSQHQDLANKAIDLNTEPRDSPYHPIYKNEWTAVGSLSDLLIMIDQWAMEANVNKLNMNEIRGFEEALTDALAIIKVQFKVHAGHHEVSESIRLNSVTAEQTDDEGDGWSET